MPVCAEKKHKHEGTHCDDWFDFATAGKWTILAVADGGGSYRFSRVGAQAAAEAVVRSLAAEARRSTASVLAIFGPTIRYRKRTWFT